MPKNRVLIRRSGSTSVSPSLDIYSVSTTMINSNKLSIPIQIEDTEEKSIETLGLIDSGAGGKFVDQNYAKRMVLWFFYLLFPTHFPCILFACSYLMLIISCLHSYFLLQTFFPSCTALLFMRSLMHSTITHAQSCTVCLLMHSLLRCSLVTQYIRTG